MLRVAKIHLFFIFQLFLLRANGCRWSNVGSRTLEDGGGYDVAVGDGGLDIEDGGDAAWSEAVLDGALVEEFVVVEEYEPRAVAVGEVEVVDDDEDCFVLFEVEILQKRHDFVLVRDVKVGGGLVEQHDRSLLGEGAGEHDALEFAAAHLVGLGVAQVPGVGHTHDVFDDVPVGLRLVLKAVLVWVATHEYDFEGGELEVGGGVLPYDGDCLGKLTGTVGTHVTIHDEHMARRGFEKTAEAPQEGGLATAVGAHDGVEASGLDGEADIGEDVVVAESE